MLTPKKVDLLPLIRKYKGKLVYQCSDEFGVIEVVDYSSNRSLHFGSIEKQSSMSLKNSHLLILSYTRAMAAGLLLIDTPQTVLILGLGGAALPKFFLHHFPNCKIDVVELREKVVEVAFKFFHLPDEPRLNIVICDVKKFFQKKNVKSYDIILMDVFDRNGMSMAIRGFPFINACKNRLNKEGCVAINLWNQPDTFFKYIIKDIQTCFHDQMLHLPVADRTNHIVFGLNQGNIKSLRKHLRKKSRELENKFRIDLPDLCDQLYKHNLPLTE